MSEKNNYSRNKELIKNTFILGIGQFVPKLTVLILLPVLTTYLATDEYGVYDLIVSLASVLVPILTLQMYQALLRYLIAYKEVEDRKNYITTSIVFVLMINIVVLPIVYIGCRLFKLENWISVLICIMLCAESLYYIFGQVARGLGRNIHYSIGAALYAIINTLLIVLTVKYLKMGLDGIVLAISLSYCAVCIYLIITTKLWNYFNIQHFNRMILKEMLKFSIPLVPNQISFWIVNMSDRLIVISFLGASANGIFSVAHKIPNMYNMAYSIFNLAWAETAMKAYDDNIGGSYYSNMFSRLYRFLMGIMLLVLAITPFAFAVLVNEAYNGAYVQMPLLFLGALFSSFTYFFGGIYMALKKTREIGTSSIVGAVINIIINLVLIKYIGLFAAGIAAAVAFGVICAYRIYDLKKNIDLKFSIAEVVVGLILFVICSALCMSKNMVCIFICAIIAIIYNIFSNKELLLIICKKVTNKLKR